MSESRFCMCKRGMGGKGVSVLLRCPSLCLGESRRNHGHPDPPRPGDGGGDSGHGVLYEDKVGHRRAKYGNEDKHADQGNARGAEDLIRGYVWREKETEGECCD